MTYRKPAQTTARQTPRILVAGLILVAAITAALGYRLLTPPPSTAASPIDIPRSEPARAQQAPRQALDEAASPINVPRSEQPRPQLPPLQTAVAVAPPSDIPRDRPQGAAPGEADGVVPASTTVFDDEAPGVANLDPTLLAALRQAATDAAGDGVAFFVNSGWRSAEYQNQLLREAVSEYGSKEEAARWVATADTSPHVSGNAVDIEPSDATVWLSEHGAEYGLCQIYRNERWHYELRPEALERGCPPMYADPTQDPRMQR